MPEDARLIAITERLKAFIRDESPGGCHLLSREHCECLLCVFEDLLAARDQQIASLQQQLKDARELYEANHG
jgi:hypothetical protein